MNVRRTAHLGSILALPALFAACAAGTDDGRAEAVGQTDEALVCPVRTVYRCEGSVCACYPAPPPPPPPPSAVAIATGYSDPVPVASDATNLYWGTADGAVFQCARPGCSTVTTLSSTGPSDVFTIVSDGATVYWVTRTGQIMTCAVGGCNDAPTVFATAPYAVGLAVDGTNVYWTTGGRSFGPAIATLMKCNKAGCGGEPTELANAASWPLLTSFSSLVVDANNAYFYVDTQPAVTSAPPGGLVSCSLEGCSTPTILYAGFQRFNYFGTQNQGLVLANGALYLTYEQGILKCGTTGCGGVPTTFVSEPLNDNFLMVADSTNLYWSGPSALETCPLSGCVGAPTVVLSDPAGSVAGSSLGGLVVDSSYLYYSFDYQAGWDVDGKIERVAK